VIEGYMWAVGVDNVRGILYWADFGKISQATLNGSRSKVVAKSGEWNVM